MRKVKVYRWMREHTPRGMEWGCLPTYQRGRGLGMTIKSRIGNKNKLFQYYNYAAIYV